MRGRTENHPWRGPDKKDSVWHSNRPCWWCTGRLAKIMSGPRKGETAYRTIQDYDGNDVQVHASCEQTAVVEVKKRKRTADVEFIP